MDDFKQILLILGCILLLYAIMYLGIMFKNISLYFAKKSKPEKIEKDTSFTTKHIDYTNQIIHVIDNIIYNEVIDFLKSLAVLHRSYDYINFDKDVSNISTIVYHGFKTDAYVSEYCILNDAYIMKYIANRVTLVLIEQASIINNNIREESNSL